MTLERIILVRISRNHIPLVFTNQIKNAPDTFQRMINIVISVYYRKFCHNFSVVLEPLTKLLRKNEPFTWSSNCQQAFEKIKSLLVFRLVVMASNSGKLFKLMVDASNVGCGAVLLQENDSEIDHPVSYCSYIFNTHQKNYLTSEKETLALMLCNTSVIFGWPGCRSTGVHRLQPACVYQPYEG